MTRRRETAYHEAGHAIIGHLYYQRCAYVTISPNETHCGHYRHDIFISRANISNKYNYLSRRVYTEIETRVDWAGVLAYLLADLKDIETEHCLDECCIEEVAKLEGILELGADEDMENVNRILKSAFPRAPEGLRLLFSLENADATARLLIKYWERVEAIAAALLERDTISGDDIEDIIGAIDNKAQPYPAGSKAEALRIMRRWKSPSTKWGSLRKKYRINHFTEREGTPLRG